MPYSLLLDAGAFISSGVLFAAQCLWGGQRERTRLSLPV